MRASIETTLRSILVGTCLSLSCSQTVLDAGLVTRSTVDEFADISLDIREIRNYRSDSKRIQTLWDDGLHFVSSDGHRGSLAKIASAVIADTSPISVIHQEGLATAFVVPRPNFLTDTVRNIVASDPELTAETTLTSVVWLYAANLLFDGVHTCHLRTVADNPNFVPQGTYGLDEFIALWMGRDVSASTSLYGLTQDISELFGLNAPEARANTAIKLLYQQGAAALALPNACTKDNPDTVSLLWMVAVQITNEMVKPLFQSLLHAIEAADARRAKIYASALVPHFHKCRPSLFKRFADGLVTGIILQMDTDTLKLKLQDAAVNCFGIPCSQLSKNGYALSCADESEPQDYHIAGYRTQSKAAATLARIDLDIRMMEILFNRSPMDQFVYQYGFHAESPRDSEFDPYQLDSLHSMALKGARSDAAKQYLEYYDVVNYAEKTLLYPLLEGTSNWSEESQQREALNLSSSFQVVFLETLRLLDEIESSCEEDDSDEDRHEVVDSVAALLIGSLEGTSLAGSSDTQDGILAWNLGSRHAFQFQTLSSSSHGNVNQDLIDELYALKSEIDSGVCSRVSRSAMNIRGLIQTGMLQSIVAASLQIEKDREDKASIYVVQAHVLTTALLPLIHQHDPETAEFLRENLVMRPGVDMVKQGASAVSGAITDYVQNELLLSPCHYLGSASSFECHQYRDNVRHAGSSGGTHQVPSMVVATVGIIAMLLL